MVAGELVPVGQHLPGRQAPGADILELCWDVAMANVVVDTGPRFGSCLNSASANSCTALSPTGFLFVFFAYPSFQGYCGGEEWHH